MTERHGIIYVIGHRRWWRGGGYDVLEGTAGAKNLMQGWPVSLAWFRYYHHAKFFAAEMRARADGEEAQSKPNAST